MNTNLYRITLLLSVSIVYTISSCREILYADNVDEEVVVKNETTIQKKEQKNTIVIDGNGKVRNGGVPENISKIIETANNVVEKYTNNDNGNKVIIIDENEVNNGQQKTKNNIPLEYVVNEKSVIQSKHHIFVDKEISVEKDGKIKPVVISDESGEFLIEFKKPAKVKCDKSCNNSHKVFINSKNNINNNKKKSSTNAVNKNNTKNNSKTTKQPLQKVKNKSNNNKPNSFSNNLKKADKVVYSKNSKQNYNSNMKNKQYANSEMEEIEQIHCVGGCNKQTKKQEIKKVHNLNEHQQYQPLEIVSNSNGIEQSNKSNQNIYIINNIVGIDEDMVITEDMIKKIEEQAKGNKKNVKQNTLFIKKGEKSDRTATLKVASADQRDKYLASLMENVSIADDIKFGEVAFVDNYDGI